MTDNENSIPEETTIRSNQFGLMIELSVNGEILLARPVLNSYNAHLKSKWAPDEPEIWASLSQCMDGATVTYNGQTQFLAGERILLLQRKNRTCMIESWDGRRKEIWFLHMQPQPAKKIASTFLKWSGAKAKMVIWEKRTVGECLAALGRAIAAIGGSEEFFSKEMINYFLNCIYLHWPEGQNLALDLLTSDVDAWAKALIEQRWPGAR